MNNGAFGENFPYSNFHDLNMDWIIKIAKDFLDQYTHIQEIIANGEESLENLTTSGLAQLQEKADNLEALLQAWYNEHSQDIADQLADALADLNEWYNTHQNYLDATLAENIATFNSAAETKSQQLLDSWPDDYSELVVGYNNLKSGCAFDGSLAHVNQFYLFDEQHPGESLGLETASGIIISNEIKVKDGDTIVVSGVGTGNRYYVLASEKNTFEGDAFLLTGETSYTIDITTDGFFSVALLTAEYSSIDIKHIKGINSDPYVKGCAFDGSFAYIDHFYRWGSEPGTADGLMYSPGIIISNEIKVKAGDVIKVSGVGTNTRYYVISATKNTFQGTATNLRGATEYTININTDGFFSIALFNAEYSTANISNDITYLEGISSPYKYRGTSICAIGDSITNGFNTTKTYLDYLSEMLQCSKTEYGDDGSTIANGSYPMYQRVSDMSGDYSLIFAFGGTNDWAIQNRTIGDMFVSGQSIKTPNENPDTFYGGLNLLFKNLITKFPNADIYAITPIHRGTFAGQTDRADTMPNSSGNYLSEFVEAVKVSASYFSIPVIDLWSDGGMNPNIPADATAYFNHTSSGVPDLLHPDANGHKRLAERILRAL